MKSVKVQVQVQVHWAVWARHHYIDQNRGLGPLVWVLTPYQAQRVG